MVDTVAAPRALQGVSLQIFRFGELAELCQRIRQVAGSERCIRIIRPEHLALLRQDVSKEFRSFRIAALVGDKVGKIAGCAERFRVVGTKNLAFGVENLAHYLFCLCRLAGFRKCGGQMVHRVDCPRVISSKNPRVDFDRTAKKAFCLGIATEGGI
jgi:hypothetical protein